MKNSLCRQHGEPHNCDDPSCHRCNHHAGHALCYWRGIVGRHACSCDKSTKSEYEKKMKKNPAANWVTDDEVDSESLDGEVIEN